METEEQANNKPLISVIVPIYNVYEYVTKCIESIVNQTYYNLEIMLVDDGSTDGSGEICDEYAKKDSRIKVFHKENGGLSDARNYALERAHGELIGFVDGDDWIHTQMYGIMLNKMLETGSDIVACGFEQKNEELFNEDIPYDKLNSRNMSSSEALINIEIPLVVAWNKLYKHFLFDDIRYPVGRLHEDEFVIHKLFNKCKKIAVIEKELYFYTVRDGSIVSKLTLKRINDALDALSDRVEYAEIVGWTDVLSAVINRYCDYCIDRYYDIESQKSQVEGVVKEDLWKAEHNMCMKYHDIDIETKNRRFAMSPERYVNYMKMREIKYKVFGTPKRLLKTILKKV